PVQGDGHRKDKDHGGPKAHGGCHLFRYGQIGTHSQKDRKYHIVYKNRLEKKFQMLYHASLLLCFFNQSPVPGSLHPDNHPDNDQGRRGNDHEPVVLIPQGVKSRFGHRIPQYLETEKGPGTQKFPEKAHDHQDEPIARGVSYTVQKGLPGSIGQGKGLKPPHDDTVGDDKAHKNRKGLAQFIGKGLEYLVHQDHQGGNNDQLCNDPDLARDDVPKEGDHNISHGQYKHHG